VVLEAAEVRVALQLLKTLAATVAPLVVYENIPRALPAGFDAADGIE
jgi:hypothetical protein